MNTQILRPNLIMIDHGMVRSFLCLGTQEALLIDTGFGEGTIADFVKTLTSLPIKVIYTHSDRDHVGDAKHFKNRWMHPAEFENYKAHDENALPMQSLSDHEVMDIGTFQFEILLIPGHTPGCIALLERTQRFLIGGDSVQIGNIFMFGQGRDFKTYLESMKKLDAMKDAFDVVYASHYTLEVPSSTLPLLIEVAQKVMNHELEGKPEPRFGTQAQLYTDQGIGFLAP